MLFRSARQYEPQRKEFKDALERAVKAGNNEAFLKDLAPFSWDIVCVVGGYNNPNQIVKHITGETSKEVENYANGENQWSFVFFEKKKLISIFRYNIREIDLAHADNECGSRHSGKLKIVPYGIALPIENHHLLDRHIIPSCPSSERNNNHCSFIFLGEKYDDQHP